MIQRKRLQLPNSLVSYDFRYRLMDWEVLKEKNKVKLAFFVMRIWHQFIARFK
ncbi:hypothetical protein [Leptospira terpstrae]|uniref:hypothetical protein n=1 Tax=Leptospira terpstrae TaxID=293075 RepID=UPI0012E9C66D|nr:hypothetical protein [Leptospira terpstrae]